ncbi:MAG TPA: carboxypeptidase regulatory-like domain-containing protein [Gemmatimonadales bacterium]|nr:carboxypeptidase regulatory-like domain-containing protein [Gemmatimonadales bacterium]
MTARLFTVVGGMFLLTVCSKGDQSTVRAAPAPAAQPAVTPSEAGGTITGKIKFTGTAPRNRPIDMSEEAACKAKYKTNPPVEETVVAGPANALANVFVYIREGVPASAKYQAPATSVVLDQNGCRYHPHVLGIMVGQGLEIVNSDPVLHNIKAIAKKNRPFNVSQPSAGMKTVRTFSAPEVMVSLQCNVHGWMNAYLGVRPDPFYAVSGPDGSFKITGLPPGTYTIEAWHEKFGTQTATVTVAGTESKTANFTFAAR